jgi:HEAT repeat protein
MTRRSFLLVGTAAALSILFPVLTVNAAELSTATVSGVELSSPTVDARTNLEKLADPDYLVRRNAVIYLGAEKKKENVPQLLAMLSDQNTEVQRAAVSALVRAMKPEWPRVSTGKVWKLQRE